MSLAAAALVLAGCGSSDVADVADGADVADSIEVRDTVNPAQRGIAAGPRSAMIAGLAFAPDPVHVVYGYSVEWTNNDDVTHTVTSTSDLEFDSGELEPGMKFSVSFDEPSADHTYVCTIHGSMEGTVEVSGPAK
jgi:plastocyanin